MLFQNKEFDQINISDIQSLIDNRVRESREIDYKQETIGPKDSDKKEFLADVSSFANASGGYIIFGITEDSGVPLKAIGININDIDSEILRLEHIIRNGIEPRITGVQTKILELSPEIFLIIIRIPKSWALPHIVSLGGNSKFFSRNSAGKHPLDVTEIRNLFILSESLNEKIKNFKLERIGQIIAGETPIIMDTSAPKMVLHLIPLSSINFANKIDLSNIHKNFSDLMPLFTHISEARYNFDGFFTYNYSEHDKSGRAYFQVFRSGIMEVVDTQFCSYGREVNRKEIFGSSIETELCDNLQKYIQYQTQVLTNEFPIIISLTLLGIKNYVMHVENHSYYNESHAIEKNEFIFPEVIVESKDDIPNQYMKPVFDTLWNSAGKRGSPNYDDQGNWVKPR